MPAVAPSRSDLVAESLPRRFGPYTLFEPIGRGGMAQLFLARAETELGATRLVVVKLILPALADDPKFSEMLVHEAKLAAGLSHRHIVNVLDLGRDDGRLYIGMEYVEGLDLNALVRLCIERAEGLPLEHALGIVADVLEGLDYAHRYKNEAGVPLGIVHRDVSPSNVLISYEGEVKLCDFGIAHANDLVSDPSEALKGKAGYMSPEHARAEPLDARADVFAAGIILWELLAGRRLYRPIVDVPLIEQARRAEIPLLPKKGLPDHKRLERIVQTALALKKEDRYPTAEAFARDLEEYLAKTGLLASRLKLGEWMTSTFGTALVEKRRASESKLPKSNAPPPRSSGAIRIRTASAPRVVIPAAPRVPVDLLRAATGGRPEAPPPAKLPVASAPQSLEGAAMDIESSNRVSAPDSGARATSDEELIVWAKKRGYVSFLFFFLIAVAVAVAWTLTR